MGTTSHTKKRGQIDQCSWEYIAPRKHSCIFVCPLTTPSACSQSVAEFCSKLRKFNCECKCVCVWGGEVVGRSVLRLWAPAPWQTKPWCCHRPHAGPRPPFALNMTRGSAAVAGCQLNCSACHVCHAPETPAAGHSAR